MRVSRPFPVFLRLAGARVVVVGGGKVAAAKLPGLLEAGALVTVVAPRFLPEVARLGASRRGTRDEGVGSAGSERVDRVEVVAREFRPTDLDGARFVIAAAPPEVNRAVAAAAAERNLFVNAVDDVASATAYLGGVVRRGEVTVAISTGGAAPALAGLLREALDALLPEDLDEWVGLARRLRAEWKRDRVPMERRRPLLLDRLVRLYPALKEANR
jgi:uroporphyrin-III C-methyltransferase/precorrin-2 dehydrogenase/sirohydrochlorin ferrochelatase